MKQSKYYVWFVTKIINFSDNIPLKIIHSRPEKKKKGDKKKLELQHKLLWCWLGCAFWPAWCWSCSVILHWELLFRTLIPSFNQQQKRKRKNTIWSPNTTTNIQRQQDLLPQRKLISWSPNALLPLTKSIHWISKANGTGRSQ